MRLTLARIDVTWSSTHPPRTGYNAQLLAGCDAGSRGQRISAWFPKQGRFGLAHVQHVADPTAAERRKTRPAAGPRRDAAGFADQQRSGFTSFSIWG